MYELACMGKIHQLLTRIRDLSEIDSSYIAFTEKLMALALRYQIKQIQTMLRCYLEKAG